MDNVSGFVKRIRDITRKDAGINGDAQRIEQLAWMLFLKVYDAREQVWSLGDKGYHSVIPASCQWRNWAHEDHSGTVLTGDALIHFVDHTLLPVLKGSDIRDDSEAVMIPGVHIHADTPARQALVQTVLADAVNYMKDGVLLRQLIRVIDDFSLDPADDCHAFGAIYEAILHELQSAGSAGEFYTPRAVTDFMAQMIQPQPGEKMADFACGTGGFITSWLKELQKQSGTKTDVNACRNLIYGTEKKQLPYMLCVTNLLLHGLDAPQIFHDNALQLDVADYTEADQVDVILMNPPYGGREKPDIQLHFPADLASSETSDLFLALIMYRLKKNGRAAVIMPDGFLFGTDRAKTAIKKKLVNEFNLHTVIRMPRSVFSPYTSITTNILFFDRSGSTEGTWFYRMDMPEGYKNFTRTRPVMPEHFAPVIAWWNNRKEFSEHGSFKANYYTAKALADRNFNLDLCGYSHEKKEIQPPLELIEDYQQKRARLNEDIDRILAQITGLLMDSSEGRNQ
jgi:type I restriction enzyme M protein